MIQLMEDGKRNLWERCEGKISGGILAWISGIVSSLYINSDKNLFRGGSLQYGKTIAQCETRYLLNLKKVGSV